jgi:hypothetical protein
MTSFRGTVDLYLAVITIVRILHFNSLRSVLKQSLYLHIMTNRLTKQVPATVIFKFPSERRLVEGAIMLFLNLTRYELIRVL